MQNDMGQSIEGAEAGMEEKSKEFREKGSEIYLEAGE
jgi:hypothetical protein